MIKPSKKTLHPDLEVFQSPGGLFDVPPCELDLNVGRSVRFKGPWKPSDGTIRRDCVFLIRGVQKNYRGELCYRVHAQDYPTIDREEQFGCVAHPNEVEFVD